MGNSAGESDQYSNTKWLTTPAAQEAPERRWMLHVRKGANAFGCCSAILSPVLVRAEGAAFKRCSGLNNASSHEKPDLAGFLPPPPPPSPPPPPVTTILLRATTLQAT
ncbi:uncharacterized [Tachysurus ichikawai]